MDFKSLVNGAKVVGVILLAVVGIYASAILGGVVVGVLRNVVASGDINVSSGMNTAIGNLETTYISTVTSVLNPIATIAALVIVVVLVGIFFGRKLNLGFGGGSRGMS